MIGPPCSGKSTWIKNNDTNSVVVSTDDLISWYADKVGKTYDQVFASGLFNSFDKIFTQMIKDYSSEGKDIIVDRTNLTEKGRAKLLSLVPETYEKHAVVFRIPPVTLFERNKVRSLTGKTIPVFVIKNMIKNTEEPSKNEFDVISYYTEIIKGNEKIVTESIKNGLEIGYTQTRKSSTSPWEEVRRYTKNIDTLWFTKTPKEIMKECGIETTERRAQDLSNLFDGSLNGYYYVRMASIDNTDEAAKLILGYISETFNNRSIAIMDINIHIPASWLRELLLNISTNKIPRKFVKDFLDEFIDLDNKSISIKEFIEERLKDPKYEVIDDSLIAKFVDIVFDKFPQAVIDAKQNPKKAGFLVGKVIQESDKKATPQVASALIMEKLKE